MHLHNFFNDNKILSQKLTPLNDTEIFLIYIISYGLSSTNINIMIIFFIKIEIKI
jgi:hypothetical protein